MLNVLICNVPKLDPHYISPNLALLKGACNIVGVTSETVDFNIDFIDICVSQGIEYEEHFPTIMEHKIVDAEFKSFVELLVEQWANTVAIKNPDLLAISIFSWRSQYFARSLITKVRLLNSNIKIIIGGAGITDTITSGPRFAHDLKKENLIDYFIEGDAEVTWPKFLSDFFKRPLTDEEIFNGNYLNTTYIPDYSDYDISRYEKYRSNDLDGHLWLPVSGSRGCVRRCTFCEIPETWNFTQRNPVNIRNEIASALSVADNLHIHFTDSLVNGSLSAFNELLDHLIELQTAKKFSWGSQFILRQGRVDRWDKIAQSGARILEIGIETGNDDLRFEMRKHFYNEDIIYALEMMQQHNIKCALLMFCGYPTESVKQFQDTLDFLKSIQRFANNTVAAIQLNYSFGVYKDTPIYKNRESIGLKISRDPAQWFCTTNPTLTFKERVRRRLLTQELLEELGFNLSHDTRIALNELVEDYSRANFGKKFTFDEMSIAALGRTSTIQVRFK